MPIIRDALSSVLGDHIASADERSLRRQAERLEKDSRKASRHGASSVVAMQALQAQVSYEIVKEQRFIRVGDTAQAARCRSIITALQQQLAAYQPVGQPYLLLQQQAAYQQMQQSMSMQPGMSMATQSYPTYPTYPIMQQQLSPQYGAMPSSAAAQPVSYSAAPPAYSDPSCQTLE